MPDGVAAAQALGVALDGAPSRAFRGIRFRHGDSIADGAFPEGCGLGMRRTVLHELLLERATAAGVRFRWGARISGLDDVRAQWIIGADGGNSRVREWAGLGGCRYESKRFGFRRHYDVVPSEYVEIFWADDFQLYLTPVAPGETSVALLCSDPRLRLDEALARLPELARQLGRPAGPSRGAITASRRLRSVWKGRVALVGDASGSVDAIAGEGLCLAFRQAEALAGALEAGDLAIYAAAHRHLSQRPRLMSNLMLLLGRSRILRKVTVGAFAQHPQWFGRLLALHVAEHRTGACGPAAASWVAPPG